MHRNKLLFTSTALAVLTVCSLSAHSAVFEKKTTIKPIDEPGVETIPFSRFDDNNDGVLTAAEVGDDLFYLFDTDGNEVLDNNEWDQEIVYTQVPVERETFVYLDTDNDGEVDVKEYDTEKLNLDTSLSQFDQDGDGLSAKEFANATINEVDLNNDRVVDIDEWKDAYARIDMKPMQTQASERNDSYGLVPDRVE